MLFFYVVIAFLAGWFWGATRNSVREAYEAVLEAGKKHNQST